MTESITVERIAAMDLHPGDDLVITLPEGASASYHSQVHAILKAWLDERHPGCDLVLMPHGTEVGITRPVE